MTGHVKCGYQFTLSVQHDFYEFPVKDIAHGCMLEGVILAFEKLYIPYSAGGETSRLIKLNRSIH